jgi:hypothetical protein
MERERPPHHLATHGCTPHLSLHNTQGGRNNAWQYPPSIPHIMRENRHNSSRQYMTKTHSAQLGAENSSPANTPAEHDHQKTIEHTTKEGSPHTPLVRTGTRLHYTTHGAQLHHLPLSLNTNMYNQAEPASSRMVATNRRSQNLASHPNSTHNQKRDNTKRGATPPTHTPPKQSNNRHKGPAPPPPHIPQREEGPTGGIVPAHPPQFLYP